VGSIICLRFCSERLAAFFLQPDVRLFLLEFPEPAKAIRRKALCLDPFVKGVSTNTKICADFINRQRACLNHILPPVIFLKLESHPKNLMPEYSKRPFEAMLEIILTNTEINCVLTRKIK